MFQKLEAVEQRYEELNKKISDPEVIAKQSEWTALMKEHAAIVDVVEKYREYKKAKNDFEEAKQMLNDKICKLREKLNESIINEEDYSIIYQLSVELDELIAEYYRKNKKKAVS